MNQAEINDLGSPERATLMFMPLQGVQSAWTNRETPIPRKYLERLVGIPLRVCRVDLDGHIGVGSLQIAEGIMNTPSPNKANAQFWLGMFHSSRPQSWGLSGKLGVEDPQRGYVIGFRAEEGSVYHQLPPDYYDGPEAASDTAG